MIEDTHVSIARAAAIVRRLLGHSFIRHHAVDIETSMYRMS